jgi:hypothetical protein
VRERKRIPSNQFIIFVKLQNSPPCVALEQTLIPFFEKCDIFLKILVYSALPTLQVPVATIEKNDCGILVLSCAWLVSLYRL